MLDGILDVELAGSVVRASAPILLAALGGLLCDRVGLFNIALEGLMIAGAFGAVVGSYASGSWAIGLVVAVLAGCLLAGMMAVSTVRYGGNIIVAAVALNLLAIAGTSYLLRQIFDTIGTFSDPGIIPLPLITVPGLSSLPLLGMAFTEQSILVYAGWLLAPALWLLLYRHPVGLRLRGVGENPAAATSLGVSVAAFQYAALLASGALCGLAGAQLSLGNVTLFADGMTSGRGWIAVVAVMLGRGNPIGVLAATLLFGLADGLGIRLQARGIPTQVTEVLPYLVTLLALMLVQWRRAGPRTATAARLE